jgi:hypothetical protein
MATPLIRIPQVSGGVFYAFASSSKDLAKTFNNDQLKFQFSKYALLNIPNIQVPQHKENFIQFLTIDGAIYSTDGNLNGDNNVNLAESLQNYALNLEALLMADNDFDTNLKKSVAERVFFKWLKELGAIRFKDATGIEKSISAPSNLFTEENTVTSGVRRYNRVVEYLGDIDVTNNVDKGGQAYTEIYLNVPVKVGNTPVVLFKSEQDSNYLPGMIITNNSEYIYGRNSSTIQPDGLSTFAFYDQDTNPPTSTNSPGAWWWSPEDVSNSYFTEAAFNDATVDEIIKTDSDYSPINFTTINYLRSKLDGITIDWNADDYYDIAVDPTISTLNEYNSSTRSKNFSFNAILVYYDLYNTSNPLDRATNLYGVLFLDNITDTPNTSYIQRLEKFKPNRVTGLNGNSYGLKLNLNFDTSIDNSTIETIINDYSQFSMDLFIDASVQLQESTRVLIESQNQIVELSDRINQLESMIFSNEDLSEVRNRLTQLEQQLNNAQLALSSPSSIFDLIANTNDTITQIINGNIPLNLQYNTDVLRNGSGIMLDRTTPNRIRITNTVQNFNINQIYSDSSYNNLVTSEAPVNLNQTGGINLYLRLEEFTNMIRVNTQNSAQSNIKIYIDDSSIRFSEGQTVRFSFDTQLLMNNYNIIISTDASNRFGSGALGLVIGTIATASLSDRPIIELTCLDSQNYVFAIDILR